nr:class D beta-lactamase [uncultured Sulfurimonas sp.]
MLNKIILFIFLSFSFLYAEDLELKKIFEKYDIDGTLVISSLKNKQNYVFNATRANERFIVASTFKIPHTLIALNEKLIKNENDTIKWNGVNREYESWNEDQTLHSAMRVSCVWCYQKFSKSISKEKYLEYLEKFNYGNKIIGSDKSSFWLGGGTLKVSAYEEIDFLKKFYTYNLPIDKKYIDITKNILSIEKNDTYEIKAKTGWSGTVGWYVGYVKTKKDIYFFAMNANINESQLRLRKKIVIDSLKIKNIL